MQHALDEPWTEERFQEALTSYCFEDLPEADRQAVEQHLADCDTCWVSFQRLDAAVRTLRFDPGLKPVISLDRVASRLGLSSRLDQPFAGHRQFAITASVMFALLFAIPFLVEFGYDFDRFGSLASTLATSAFMWMLAATVFGLRLAIKSTKAEKPGALAYGLGVWAIATVLVCAAAWPFLPNTTSVQAAFQTWPVHFGYLKSVFYAWLVGPVFVLWPVQFVVAMQRELRAGRYRSVLGLLADKSSGLLPRGVLYPRLIVLGVYLAGLFVFNWVGLAHLFENLQPDPQANLFRGLVLARVTIWLGLPVVCIWWYAGCLNELKREAYALRMLSEPSR